MVSWFTRPPAAQGCGRGCQTFSLQMIFTQHRRWNLDSQQVSVIEPICTRTEAGHGKDDVYMQGKGQLYLPQAGRPAASLTGATGVEIRSGVMTDTAVGESCASLASWPNTGCGRKPIAQFPSLKVTGNTLRVHWTSNGRVPEFKPCPFYDGSNDASEGNMLPKGDLFDVSAKVNLKALRNASKRRVDAGGIAHLAATETCANLQQGCAEGVSYNATGSVEGILQFIFVRQRP